MNQEYTLSILKPDVTRRNIVGNVISYLEGAGLKIVAQKMIIIPKDQAQEFYIEHKEKPFYQDLIDFITSGPVVVQVLKGENAITKNREIMGATKPEEWKPGTIRHDFGVSIDQNSVHGSDGVASAKREIDLFFSPTEITE